MSPFKLSDQLKALVNNGIFDMPFEAIVDAPAEYIDLEQLTYLRVSITPREETDEVETRSTLKEQHTIDIAVQKLIKINNKMIEVRELSDLVQQIKQYLKFKDLPSAYFYGISIDPIYALDHLQQHNVFTSVISLVYEVPDCD